MSSMKENYDPEQPVCDNQDDFNQALSSGLDYITNKNIDDSKPWLYVYIVLWCIFFIWAIVLAMKVSGGTERVEHLVFAMLFSPAYVIAYYISSWGAEEKSDVVAGFRFY